MAFMKKQDKKLKHIKEKAPMGIYKKADALIKIIGVIFIIVCIIAVGSIYTYDNDGGWLLVLCLLGSIAFLPIGIMLGFYVGDKYRFVKFLKMIMPSKNWVIVNFVTLDGKNILYTKIKNLKSDILEKKGEAIWRVERGRIYNDKGDISYDTDDFIKYKSGVPTIFLDASSFRPKTFLSEDKPIDSRELMASVKAWVIIQESKLLALKKLTQILIIVMIAVAIASAGLSYMTYDMVKKMTPLIQQAEANSASTAEAVKTIGSIPTVGG
jgi:hypothetical protein